MNDIPSNKLGTSKWLTDSDKRKLRAMYKCEDTGPGPSTKSKNFNT